MSMLSQRFCYWLLLGLIPLRSYCATDDGLIAHWKLQGNSQDSSGRENHGRNHYVDLSAGSFNGRNAYIEITSSKSLNIGGADFSIVADLFITKDVRGAFGTLVSRFDPARRRGFNLALCSN